MLDPQQRLHKAQLKSHKLENMKKMFVHPVQITDPCLCYFIPSDVEKAVFLRFVIHLKSSQNPILQV